MPPDGGSDIYAAPLPEIPKTGKIQKFKLREIAKTV
jgi:hypothetical protein